jgi:hypothetical protein
VDPLVQKSHRRTVSSSFNLTLVQLDGFHGGLHQLLGITGVLGISLGLHGIESSNQWEFNVAIENGH